MGFLRGRVARRLSWHVTLAAMKRLGWVFVLLAAGAVQGNSQTAVKNSQVFVIHRPTIVAFFPPVTAADLDSDENTSEALADFQFYAGEVRTPLLNAGIDFREADAPSFRIRVGTKVRTFHAGKIGIGYYFIAPGKRPHLESGVMTDADLLEVARKYFGIVIPKEACTVPHCPK
jgi:hypothetical protein